MVSPSQQTAIRGEGNIARYLGRLLQPCYDDADVATIIDDTVDLVQNGLMWGDEADRTATLRILDKRLSEGGWLAGPSLTLADVVAWSGIQQMGLIGEKLSSLNEWLDRCRGNQVFQTALPFVLSGATPIGDV